MKNRLPADFLWGNSVSSMQTEGAWNEGGKGMSVYDIRQPAEFASDWKVATDSYHRYREDFDLMQDLGVNCYRFQIAWSRVCPDGDGEFNEQGIAFYHQFIDELIARGIEPMICLYHFDMPLSLAERYNGFTDRRVMDAFIRYGQKMIACYGDKVKYWLTFNEQNLYHSPEAFLISGYLQGGEDPARTVSDPASCDDGARPSDSLSAPDEAAVSDGRNAGSRSGLSGYLQTTRYPLRPAAG